MNFNSPVFPIFFLSVFALYWTIPYRLRWPLLLMASWLFYFCWNLWTGFLLVGITLISWLCAGGISQTGSAALRKCLMFLALTASLGCLALFKYAGFFASVAGVGLTWRIILPAGISFYTFQTLSYVIDVYRCKIKAERNFGRYALFISFFPQLVAGPIERPEHLLPQFQIERRFSLQYLPVGGWLLLKGYFKKIVIADGLAPFVDQVYNEPEMALGPEIVLATLLFGIQIYGDFSGYSDIARGTAKLLGIDLMENFKRPYGAATVQEFWQRWHISLTSWFTDYVYIPLGGNRRGTLRQVRNILLVFLLSGLWHGAGWTFLIWGLIHGLYLSGGVLLRRWRGCTKGNSGLIARIRTFLLVSFPWLFFRARSLEDAVALLSRLTFGWSDLAVLLRPALPVLPLLLCLPLLERFADENGKHDWLSSALAIFCAVVTISTAWMAQLAGGGQNAFIYFQF